MPHYTLAVIRVVGGLSQCSVNGPDTSYMIGSGGTLAGGDHSVSCAAESVEREKQGDYNTAVQWKQAAIWFIYNFFFFNFIFFVKAFHQSLKRHSYFCLKRKRVDSRRFWNIKVSMVGYKLAAISVVDSRGSSFIDCSNRMRESSWEIWLSLVGRKSTVASPVQCGLVETEERR